MSLIFPYINILRPLNLIFAALSVVIVAYLTDSLNQTSIIISGVMVVVSFAGASNILNDLLDINIDKKNKPNRPLPSGKISVWTALVYMLAIYFFGIGWIVPQSNALALQPFENSAGTASALLGFISMIASAFMGLLLSLAVHDDATYLALAMSISGLSSFLIYLLLIQKILK